MRLLALLCLVGATGCLDRIILDGTLQSTRQAAKALDTLSDLEVAKEGAGSSLVQIEGMNTLAPDNDDGLFLLTQSWTGYASAFIEDSWEQAVDKGDDEGEAWHAGRAKNAYDQAVKLGVAPREAWNLERVQEDTLNPKACSEGERVKYAPPDAGVEEDVDDALMKEMMQ